MSCVLRISGGDLNINAMLELHPLPVQSVWTKGEARILKGRFHTDSGANVVVSEAQLEQFDRQSADAVAFLELHAPAIGMVGRYPGVEEVIFDFGVALVEDHITQSSYLSPQLIQLAAIAGIGIVLSHYPCSEDVD
jgi:hypothetical protein